jgi:hypothetical protein
MPPTRRRRISDRESDETIRIVTEGSSLIEKIIPKSGWAFITHQLAEQTPLQKPTNFASSPLANNLAYYDDYDPEPEIEEFIMTARDRTMEFSTAIRSLQGRNISRAINIKDPRKAKQLQSYSEFMMIAKHIGKNIASTYTKLEKLTLCKCGARLGWCVCFRSICVIFVLQWPNVNRCLTTGPPRSRS